VPFEFVYGCDLLFGVVVFGFVACFDDVEVVIAYFGCDLLVV